MAPTLIAIVGPTASGKTSLAIELASHWQAPILSFDSRQCYSEMRIGVARPTPTELEAAKHYFIASHSIHQPVDAAAYENYALQLLQQLFASQPVVIAVGGTGLYLKALLHGLDAMPPIDEDLRRELRTQYATNGLAWLQQQVQALDPRWMQTGESQNPHRLLRALEVVRQTGQSILTYQQQQTAPRPFAHHIVGLSPQREVLYQNINQRVLGMLDEGLENEVHQLQPWRHLAPLQTVGYTEMFDYFDGKCTLQEATASIQQHTRNYAKRQLTWFRRQTQVHWLQKPDRTAAVQYLQPLLHP